MEPIKTLLMPVDSRKSFYGKAVMHTYPDHVALLSYTTIVCSIHNGEFKRHWNDYSATTMRHVDAFRVANGLPRMGKAEWEKLPVTRYEG